MYPSADVRTYNPQKPPLPGPSSNGSSAYSPLQNQMGGTAWNDDPTSWPVQPMGTGNIQLFICWPLMPLAILSGCIWYLIGIVGMFFGLIALFIGAVIGSAIFLLCGCPLCIVAAWFTYWECPLPIGPQWISGLYLKILYVAFQFEIYFHTVPDLGPKSLKISNLKPPDTLEKFDADFTQVKVPYGFQEEQDNTDSFLGKLINDALNNQGPFGCIGWIFEDNLYKLPFHDSFEEFEEDENPVEFAMRHVGNMYPTPYQVWPDKQSDAALARFCRNGMGAHRVDVSDEPEGKLFVVRTNMLAGLPVRDGFANYGGDAFFDQNWRVVKIEDHGIGEERRDRSGRVPMTIRPGDAKWAEAKFRFRSSLSALVTVVDHLFGIHLVVANFMLIATREQLPTNHPIRRFLMPYYFNTIAVNDNAATNLCRRDTLASRCFSLTYKGLEQAYGAGPSLLRFGFDVSKKDGGPFLDYERYVAYLKNKGIDTEYYQQGLKYWLITKRWIAGVVRYYYDTPSQCANDPELMSWARSYLSSLTELTYESLTENESKFAGSDYDLDSILNDHQRVMNVVIHILAQFCVSVTGHHEQVGAVEAYVQDVSWCAFKFTPGSLAGTKQTATAQALLMMMTATPMSKIWPCDWSHVFEKRKQPNGNPDPWQCFAQYQTELGQLAAEVEQHNTTCASKPYPHHWPMYVWDPRVIETSISV